RRRHTRFSRDWSSDVCSSDLSERLSTRDQEPIRRAPTEASQQPATESPRRSPARSGAPLTSTVVTAKVFAGGRPVQGAYLQAGRSEERRVGKECRTRRTPRHG